MNERLLRELSRITEEEQDILDGKTGIDRTLYSEGSDFVITSEKMPASVTLYRFFGSHTISYGSLAAFSIIYAIPSIILYVLSQKYMSKGFAMEGGAKG